MSAEALTSPFQNLELFQGLSHEQLQGIVRHAERMVFQPGQPIIRDGEAGDAAVLIVNGIAERTAAPHSLEAPEPIEAGALVGEMAMLIETEHTSTVVAKTAVRALRLVRTDLHRQMLEDPTLADHFVARIAARLRRLAVELHKIDGTLGGAGSGAEQHPH